MSTTPSAHNLIVRILLLFVLISFSLSCSERSQIEIEQTISEYPTLQAADRLCGDLQVPNGFRFVRKDFFGNSEYGVVIYRYATDLRAAEVADFYKQYLPARGLDFVAEQPETARIRLSLLFQKNKEFVAVERTGVGEVNYGINCGIKNKQ